MGEKIHVVFEVNTPWKENTYYQVDSYPQLGELIRENKDQRVLLVTLDEVQARKLASAVLDSAISCMQNTKLRNEDFLRGLNERS